MYQPERSPQLQPDRRQPTGDEQRTYLAGERTLLAWIRTSLALMGFGFLVAKFGLFLREVVALRGNQGAGSTPVLVPRTGLSLWIGVCLVVLGLFINVFAAKEHLHFLRQFAGTDLGAPRRYIAQIALLISLTLLGAAMTGYLLLVGK